MFIMATLFFWFSGNAFMVYMYFEHNFYDTVHVYYNILYLWSGISEDPNICGDDSKGHQK